LKAAQVGSVLSEDHGFWIDFACLYRVRCVFMELGRRLAEAGVLSGADDVFYLTLSGSGQGHPGSRNRSCVNFSGAR